MEEWYKYTLAQLRRLVERSLVDVNEKDPGGGTILDTVVQRGGHREGHEDTEKLLAFVTWLIDEKGVNINGNDDNTDYSPLDVACSPLVGLLLDRGANPRSLDFMGMTPLMAYVTRAEAACVARLLEHAEGRATVNMQAHGGEDQGSTALHFVGDMCPYTHIKESQVHILELLHGAGTDTTIIDSKGRTAQARLREEISERRV